jgi:hypothetical protein
MKILTAVSDLDDTFANYQQEASPDQWRFVLSGTWYGGYSNSGHIAYNVQRTPSGNWLMQAVERNAELDFVTEEDVAAGALNDDQRQAMWGMTLAQAQALRYERIVGVLLEAPHNLSAKSAARHLYRAIEEAGGKIVAEPHDEGLLDWS